MPIFNWRGLFLIRWIVSNIPAVGCEAVVGIVGPNVFFYFIRLKKCNFHDGKNVAIHVGRIVAPLEDLNRWVWMDGQDAE